MFTSTLFAAALVISPLAAAVDKQESGAGTPVRVLVTVEAPKNSTPPNLTRDDVMAFLDNQRALVTDWTPARAAGLQLWLVIDDGSASALGNQLDDLRKFVLEQPANTEIGIGYIQNGSVKVVQKLTSDHTAAVKSLRLPLGLSGISASPYLALTELIKKWPSTSQAREVLMVSSGIDPDYGPGPQDPYLDQAIKTAQRAGVPVNSIYFESAGHLGHSLWQINWGQNNLSQLADETGGEFFWQGNYSPVAFLPYLKELNQHLDNQHLLTVAARGMSGEKRLKVLTEVPHASLMSQTHVYVTPGK